MIGIYFNKITEQKAEVVSIIYVLDILTQEDKAKNNYIEVASILEPEYLERKRALHYINPQTGEQWYEYEDVPKTKEEILEGRIDLMQQALDEILLNGGTL
jgi:hypothetical protein